MSIRALLIFSGLLFVVIVGGVPLGLRVPSCPFSIVVFFCLLISGAVASASEPKKPTSDDEDKK